jgi:c-di-GMP-binding flagellar brake protein YcgR
MTEEDRRQYPRIAYGAWIEEMSQEGSLRFYLSKDLSLGGMLLASEEPPDVGSQLRLRLIVENEQRTMTLHGKVVRHAGGTEKERLFAVRFIEMDEDRIGFLQDLLEGAGVEA